MSSQDIIFTEINTKMDNFRFRSAVFGALLSLLVPAMRAEAKNPPLKNSGWICVHEIFVHDAGTMTETYTLDFTSGKECVLTCKWVMPAHPATYVGPDGTVDIIPERSSESILHGTWKLRGKKLTLNLEDGSTRTYLYRDGKLLDSQPSPEVMEFLPYNIQK